jgi:hypothetical protein
VSLHTGAAIAMGLTMTDTALPTRAKLAERWPTALALIGAAAAILVIVLLDREVELFGPLVVMMAGIYLMAYAIGRPASAWLALVVLSTAVSVLQVLDGRDVPPVDPAVGMSIVVLLVWLWTLLRRRFTDGATFTMQTAGMVGFGAVTLVCAVLAPRWGILLAGAGFLAHAAWDTYHFRANKVVNRPYAEFCGVVDVVIGLVLIVVALT